MTTGSSFDDYVASHSVALQRFAYYLVRNAEDARDLVQDALVGLYPRWAQVSARGEVDPYVRRSIVNASVDRWRRQGRVTPVAEPEFFTQVDDPTQSVADADEAWRLCATLPPVQRAAVVMRFYEDRTFADIAEVLGCPEATARSHVHRALTVLRTRLIKENGHD